LYGVVALHLRGGENVGRNLELNFLVEQVHGLFAAIHLHLRTLRLLHTGQPNGTCDYAIITNTPMEYI
jgi:hypothetical protein